MLLYLVAMVFVSIEPWFSIIYKELLRRVVDFHLEFWTKFQVVLKILHMYVAILLFQICIWAYV